MSDHTEAVLARKESIDAEVDREKRASLANEGQRHSKASLHHSESVHSISTKAHHLSSDDISAARQRKELHDCIDEAAAHRKAHEIDLKQELATANRIDHLHGIQEKPKQLQ